MFSSLRRKASWLFLGSLALLFVVATAYTGTQAGITDYLGAVSLYAVTFAGIVLITGGWYLLDWTVLDQFDTWKQLAQDNRAVAIFVVGLLLAYAIIFHGAVTAVGQPAPQPTAHVDTAETYIGVTESPPGSNMGGEVERFLSVVDLGGGYPYCAAAVSAWLEWADVEGPTEDGQVVRTALATDFLESECVIDAGDVLTGRKDVPPGAVAVWQKGNSKFGHTGPVKDWDGRCGTTIEANTTPPARHETRQEGSQRDGQGVYRRERCIRPHSYFRIVGFALPTCTA